MAKLYQIIPFAVKHGNCGGSLVQFEPGDGNFNALPFKIGKVLVMSDIRLNDIRGNHAHHETEEILVALTGGCIVDVDDGKGRRESVVLSSSTDEIDQKSALLLHPHLWRILRDFQPNTMLMVIANRKYDENDYIRDRSEFERKAQTWSGLGGSSEV